MASSRNANSSMNAKNRRDVPTEGTPITINVPLFKGRWKRETMQVGKESNVR
jgi:hypothetical protein